MEYVCQPQRYVDYYTKQAGQGLTVFRGSAYQRGSGLGQLFRGVMRSVQPLLVRGGKALGKTVLKEGLGAAREVLQGAPLKPTLKRRARHGGTQLIVKALKTLDGAGSVDRNLRPPPPGRRGKPPARRSRTGIKTPLPGKSGSRSRQQRPRHTSRAGPGRNSHRRPITRDIFT